MRARILGAVVFGLLGFWVGVGTGIVGGVFGAIAGVGVFTGLGVLLGIFAGPDLMQLFTRIRERLF